MNITVSNYMNFQNIFANVVKYFNSIYIQHKNCLINKCITHNYNESIDIILLWCTISKSLLRVKLKFIEYL